MQIAVLGLGRMGRSIADKFMAEGHTVAVWNRSKEVLEKIRLEKADFIVNQKLNVVHSLEGLRDTLLKPRVFWVMVSAGEPTESILQGLREGIAETGDIIIDGGNANYKDTQRRSEEFEKLGIRYLGIGVSGGIHGAKNGYPLMVGGNQSAYEYIKPLLDSLIKPSGVHTYFGTGGAGHFVKMVHNGIEYGMMQSIAEGFGILAQSEYHLNLVNVGNTWQRGSIVASFLMEMAVSALIKDSRLAEYDGYIDAKGEGKWTVETAKELHVPTPVIEQALAFRDRSQYDKAVQDTFVAKMVAALRHEFGGHEQGKPGEADKE